MSKPHSWSDHACFYVCNFVVGDMSWYWTGLDWSCLLKVDSCQTASYEQESVLLKIKQKFCSPGSKGGQLCEAKQASPRE